MEQLDRLREQRVNVSGLERHRQLPGIDAGDIDQVADETVHARRVALDPRGRGSRARSDFASKGSTTRFSSWDGVSV